MEGLLFLEATEEREEGGGDESFMEGGEMISSLDGADESDERGGGKDEMISGFHFFGETRIGLSLDLSIASLGEFER